MHISLYIPIDYGISWAKGPMGPRPQGLHMCTHTYVYIYNLVYKLVYKLVHKLVYKPRRHGCPGITLRTPTKKENPPYVFRVLLLIG